MKAKQLIFNALCALFCFSAAQAQQTFIQLVSDTTNQTYRFVRIEVRQYESLSDTLITDRFPERWLTAAELKAYQEALIAQQTERVNELSRLRKMANDEVTVHIGYYDQLQGSGAWVALQKAQVKAALQGAWTLIERNGETTRTPVTITDFTLRKNANKFGTLTINDDLSITLSGYFGFNLSFNLTDRGVWQAERQGKLYILKQ